MASQVPSMGAVWFAVTVTFCRNTVTAEPKTPYAPFTRLTAP